MTGNVTFQEGGIDNIYYRKINNYTSRTNNRRHKSLDIQVNTVITLPRRNYDSSLIPLATPRGKGEWQVLEYILCLVL